MISVKDLDNDGSITMGKDVLQQEFTGLQDGLGFTEAPGFIVSKTQTGITQVNIICSVLSVGVSKWVTQHQIQCTVLGHGAAL